MQTEEIDIADGLIAIREVTPAAMRSIVEPLLAQNMQVWLLVKELSETIDRMHAESCDEIVARHEATISSIQKKIIQLHLAAICRVEGVEPDRVIERLTPHCELEGDELVIRDPHGVPVDFQTAIFRHWGDPDENWRGTVTV